MYLGLPITLLFAQESIFNGFRSDFKKANDFFENGAYHDAASLYTLLINHKKGDNTLHMKIGNSYFMVNKMDLAVSAYTKYEEGGGEFNKNEKLQYADALQAIGEYEMAIQWFQKYLHENSEDEEISLRIWQLQNIQYLYEDSIFYTIKRLPVNSKNDEICPTLFGNSVVFASNRETAQAFSRIDANNKPFFRWYISAFSTTDDIEIMEYTNEKSFGSNINTKYHNGAIFFYESGDSIVFVRTAKTLSKSIMSPTQIFFARKDGNSWIEFDSFPFNSVHYNVNHPALSEDGKTLFFSSDMPGGNGGMDLYKTELVNGQWTNLQNMGDRINTRRDDKYPFIRNQTLYFSSNGHPGFGGSDIFEVNLNDNLMEVVNPGYPLNSKADDFGLVLNKTEKFGYMVSNRNQENANDDIFEVFLSKPTYPLTISGKIKYKIVDVNDSASSEMQKLDFAKLELIDKLKKSKVHETESNADGSFTIQIPYEGQFILGVNKKDFGEAIVSMNIPRNPKYYLNHDIVIVKDMFGALSEAESHISTIKQENPSIYDQ